MLQVDCPSCGMLFADKDIPWNREKRRVETDASLTAKEKKIKLAKKLDELGLQNYCCRMRFLGHINEILLVK